MLKEMIIHVIKRKFKGAIISSHPIQMLNYNRKHDMLKVMSVAEINKFFILPNFFFSYFQQI